MNKRAVLLLGVITAALIAYVLVFERTSLTSKELLERKDKVLTSFVRQKVDRLEIQRRNKRVVLGREPPAEGGEFGGWRMLEPSKEAADDDAVDALLGELEWLSARRTLETLSADDVRSFGLDKPRYRVAFHAGDERHVLALGNADVHGEGVYARVDDEPVAFVVPKTVLESLDHDPLHYRSKEFLGEMTIAWARKLELTGAQKVEVEKDKGRFWVHGEVKTLGDERRIEPVLRALDDLRATRFLEPDAAPAAEKDLQKPVQTVRLTTVPDEGREDREPLLVNLQIGGPCLGHEGELFARAGEKASPVCIKADDAKSFAVAAADLRLASPFAADPSSIERLELQAGKDKLVLTRDGENWKAEGDAKVDREAVEQWLTELASEKAVQFLPAGAFSARAAVTLLLAGDRKETLSLGQTRPDGTMLVSREGEGALVAFPRSLADELTPSPRRFLPLSPWSAHKPSDVTSIEARDGKVRRALSLSDGSWRAADAKTPVNTDEVRLLVRDLMNLRALSFVAESPREEHGLATPAADVRLKLGVTTLSLALGAETEDRVYGRVDAGPVLAFPRETLTQLKALAGTAAAPAPPVEDDEHEAEADLDELHDHAH